MNITEDNFKEGSIINFLCHEMNIKEPESYKVYLIFVRFLGFRSGVWSTDNKEWKLTGGECKQIDFVTHYFEIVAGTNKEDYKINEHKNNGDGC